MESYVSARVRELTHDEQTPTTAKPATMTDFLLADVPSRRQVYTRWWFWVGATVVGGAALGAILGSTLGRGRDPLTDGGTIAVRF